MSIETEVLALLKQLEGTKQYQTKMKYFRNGLFHIYTDSEGFETIGYGHLVKTSERSKLVNGITEQQADQLLLVDYQKAKRDADSFNLDLPERWNALVSILIFQLGKTGYSKFVKHLSALKNRNYATAIAELKNSKLYQQTPNRIDQLLYWVTN
ncbi:glycoside hydrolase family protein [Leclercia sp.]|uniref:glycoside hydrolase family protein n=1 Tax=Leclercia sp. TaxID=1898428 RepID=UPI0028A64213|nr:glycoside hydrolase family protein [Leclercia sp.]